MADQRLNKKHKIHSCPICGGTIKKHYWKTIDKETFQFAKCRQCAFKFVNPRPRLNFLKEFYKRSGDKKENPTVDELLREEKRYPFCTKWAKKIIADTQQHLVSQRFKHKPLFLDVGCGYGFFAGQAKKSGFLVDALEIAEHERKICYQLTGLRPRPVIFEEFKTEKKYSVIFMHCILEHVGDINLWIKKAHGLLEQGGILAVTVPNARGLTRVLLGKRDPSVSPPFHLNYFNKKNLRKLLQKHGFKVLQIINSSPMHPASLLKRLPKFNPLFEKVTRKILELVLQPTVSILDFSHLGFTIRAYAKKDKTNTLLS